MSMAAALRLVARAWRDPGVQASFRALSELFRDAAALGYGDPSPQLWAISDRAARFHGLPPELVAAIGETERRAGPLRLPQLDDALAALAASRQEAGIAPALVSVLGASAPVVAAAWVLYTMQRAAAVVET